MSDVFMGDESEKRPRRRGGHEPVLHQILAQKILQGHLQNRHQLIDRGLADLDGRPPEEAALLIRAMAAAAHADGALDPQEHEILLAALASTGLGPDEQRSLEQEIAGPALPRGAGPPGRAVVARGGPLLCRIAAASRARQQDRYRLSQLSGDAARGSARRDRAAQSPVRNAGVEPVARSRDTSNTRGAIHGGRNLCDMRTE